MKVWICVTALFIGAMSGCSTIINGTTQDVSVSSDPPGARVTADGNSVGVTPVVLDLKRKDNHIITVSMEGFHTEQIAVTKVLSGAVAGNILAGGLIGWGVDAASGAQYKLKPDTIAVQLRPLRAGEVDVRASAGFSPEDRLRQLDQLRRDGIITQQEFDATKAEILKDMMGSQDAVATSPASRPDPVPATASKQTGETSTAGTSWLTEKVDKED